jgi:hypothetical protein
VGLVYLDTSCLVRRAELSGANPTPRSQHAGTPVVALLQGTAGAVGISEIGLLEFHDVVTGMWRDTNAPNAGYDEEWRDAVVDAAMKDIEQGGLLVLAQPAKVFEKAMALVTMATRQYGRKFRVWDAVHLITAVSWSISLTLPLELWTTDGDFEGFTAIYPYFATLVSVRNLDH